MTQPILPGATLGVLGGGQLGRMFAIAARQMGYHVHVFASEGKTPTGPIADLEVQGAFDDAEAIKRFVDGVDVVTFEFENVPAVATNLAARDVPVRPDGAILQTTQNRLREKTFLQARGLPVTVFERVTTAAGLAAARERIGTPVVLKTAAWGYDGKGQQLINAHDAVDPVWAAYDSQEAILEGFVDFACELSVIVARGLDGDCAFYGPVRNAHADHILDVSTVPAGIDRKVEQAAIELARTVAEALDVIGVLCVEMFCGHGGELTINELAPRPHNSGHLTIDAHVTSQFEQQVRAICGLPLGSTRQLAPAACANLLGDLWANGEPNWAAVTADPEIKLHLYGKNVARPKRKMGHLTCLAATAEEAESRVRQARKKGGGALSC